MSAWASMLVRHRDSNPEPDDLLVGLAVGARYCPQTARDQAVCRSASVARSQPEPAGAMGCLVGSRFITLQICPVGDGQGT